MISKLARIAFAVVVLLLGTAIGAYAGPVNLEQNGSSEMGSFAARLAKDNGSFADFGFIGTNRMDLQTDPITLSVTAPEPSTLALFGGGLLGIAGIANYRKKHR